MRIAKVYENIPRLDVALLAFDYAEMIGSTEVKVIASIMQGKHLGVKHEGEWFVEAPPFYMEDLKRINRNRKERLDKEQEKRANLLESVRFKSKGHAECWHRLPVDPPKAEKDIKTADYEQRKEFWPLREFDNPLDVLEFLLEQPNPPRPGDLLITSEYDLPGEPCWVWHTYNFLLLTQSQWEAFEGRSSRLLLERPDLPFLMHWLREPYPSVRRIPL